ncbi:MAG: NosD domain-containing protein, partial [bacterium]
MTITESIHGISLSGATDVLLRGLSLRGNTVGISLVASAANNRIVHNNLSGNNHNGLKISGSSSNFIVQNRFSDNTGYQIATDGSGNKLSQNNLYPSSVWPDSGVLTTGPTEVLRNWWSTADSGAINRMTVGDVDYIPHRLGEVDTSPAGDSLAPVVPPNASIDTSVAQQITVRWDPSDTDEDGTSLSGRAGYRIYRLKNTADTVTWSDSGNLLVELPASDTSYTDTDIEKREGYYYRVTAFDNHDTENESYFTRVLSGTWVNRIPIANSFTVGTQQDSQVAFKLTGSDSDGDSIDFFINEGGAGDSLYLPSNGSLDTSAFSASDPKLKYTPEPDTFVGTDSMTFVVRDATTISDTGLVTFSVVRENKVRVKAIGVRNEPVEAGSGGTIPVRVSYQNPSSGAGSVLRDTDDISIQNSVRDDLTDSFAVTLSGTDVRVDGAPGSDTPAKAFGEWGIQVPSPEKKHLTGNFTVSYDVGSILVKDALKKDTKPIGDSLTINQAGFNIRPKSLQVKATQPDSGIDTFSVTVQSVELKGGLTNSLSSLKGDSLADGDSVLRMVQRGGTDTIDTPYANPAYELDGPDTFTTRMDRAYDTLLNQPFPNQPDNFNRNIEILEDELLLISLWRNNLLTGDYLGNSAQLNERARVKVGGIDYPGQPERLKVLKLVPDDFTWAVVDELNDPGDVTEDDGKYKIRFDVSADPSVEASGFSVFQVVASGVVGKGDADDAIAYPNPFVPYDGNPETGQYGRGENEGIYFGAGENLGFPAGTKLEIYNVKGERIVQFTLNKSGVFQWDARTGNGDPVASGVYVFRIETPDGEQKVGKFAVVR